MLSFPRIGVSGKMSILSIPIVMNRKSIYRFLMPVLLWAAIPAAAQTGGVHFGYTPGGISNVDAYRPLEPSHHFSTRFLLDSTYVYEAFTADTAGSVEEWLLKERALHHYDGDGLENVLVRSLFDGEDWHLSERLEFTYRAGNDLEKTLKKVWSEDLQDWVKHEQLTYSYTYAGRELEVLTEAWMTDRWTATSLSEKFYGDEDQLKRHITSRWSGDAFDWIPEEQLLYTYEAHTELPVTERLQSWSDSLRTWINEAERRFVYDEDDNIIEAVESTWSVELGDFVPVVFTEWAYNNNGQQEDVFSKPLDGFDSGNAETVMNIPIFGSSATYNDDGNLNQLVTQEWDKDNETWQPVRYEKNFWSHYISGNAAVTDPDITCVYANPHTIGLPWYCESLKREVQYTLELFDITGRLYYADTFMGGNTFRIKRNIPSGMYIALITGGLDRHTEKVIIR